MTFAKIPYIVLLAALCICGTSEAGEYIEEILVTAEFRDVAAMKRHGSTSVIDGTTIIRREARHLAELLNLAPNVNFSSGASRGRFIQIRGIGERSQFIEPLNPSVGILIDGIDFSGIAGAATTLDIQQLEILRGPQGTLYGANALAGLINLKSNDPTPQLEANLQAAAGDYGHRTLGGVISGPINTSLGYRLAVQSNHADGFVENDHFDRDDTNNIDEFSARGKLLYQASDELVIGLTAFYVDADNGYDAFSLDNTRHTLSDQPGHDRHEATAIAIETSWQGDSFDLVALASHANNKLEYGYDEDWSFVGLCSGTACEGWEYSSIDNYHRERDTSSLDVRLQSRESDKLFNDTTHWVAGIYWRDQDESLLRQWTFASADFTSSFDTRNVALYGQLDSQLSNSLNLSTGLRVERRNADYADSDIVEHDVGENLWGGRIALEYDASDRTMIYGLLSRGYKAGGVNSNPALAELAREFDTEHMWNLETGIKGNWLQGRWQTQLALFYQQRDEMQVKQSLVEPIAGNSCPCSFTDYFDNAANGSNYGLEFEFNWRASDLLKVYGSVGLLHTEFDDFLSFSHADADAEAGTPVDLSGREQSHAPSYQFSLGAELAISQYWTFTLDLDGKDEFYLSPRHEQKTTSYELLHASVHYRIGPWELSLWGRNLTDEEVIVRGLFFGSFGNDPRKFYAPEPYYQFGGRKVFGFSARVDL